MDDISRLLLLHDEIGILEVGQALQKLDLSLQLLVGLNDRRAVATEGVRDGRVVKVGEVLRCLRSRHFVVACKRRVVQQFRKFLKGLVTASDSRLTELAKRQLRRIVVECGHGGFKVAGVEDQLHEGLNRRLKTALRRRVVVALTLGTRFGSVLLAIFVVAIGIVAALDKNVFACFRLLTTVGPLQP